MGSPKTFINRLKAKFKTEEGSFEMSGLTSTKKKDKNVEFILRLCRRLSTLV